MSKSIFRQFKNFLAGFTVDLISRLPISFILKLGESLGLLLLLTNNRNRQIAKTNLHLCFPNADKNFINKTLKKSLQESSITLLEALWLWRHGPYAVRQLIGTTKNEHLLLEARNPKQSTIFVTPHFGSWEYAGLRAADHVDIMILYARAKLAAIDTRSIIGRSSTGASLQEVTQSDLRNLINHVKNGGNIGILPDQVPTDNAGEFARFFHRKAFTSTIIAKLANRYNCKVVLAYALRNEKKSLRYDMHYYEAPPGLYSDNHVEATRALNKSIEEMIEIAPQHYLWSYKRFKIPAPGDSYPY